MTWQKIPFFLAILTIGCAAPQIQRTHPADLSSPNSSAADSSVAQEEFDPQTLMDDDAVLQPPARAEAIPPAEVSQIEGFRVQVAALRDHNRAEALREQIQRDAQVLTYIHLDEDIQLYKIQAGNSRTPESAETLRDAIRALGFPEAYVVRAQNCRCATPSHIGVSSPNIFFINATLSGKCANGSAYSTIARRCFYRF